MYFSPFRWPCGLRRGFAAARLLGLWVRIQSGAWMSVSSECRMYCLVEISATGRFLVQRSPSVCVCVCVCAIVM
jgi:hypothetical protein